MNKERRDIRRSVYEIINETSQIDVMLINVPSKWMKPKNGLFCLPNVHLELSSNNSNMLFGDQDYEPNHGLLTIASYLQSKDINVDLYDMQTLCYLEKNKDIKINVEEKLYDMLRVRSPHIVGLSCMTPTLPIAKRISNLIREILPDSTIILGGMASVDVNDCFLDSNFDVIIRGEGEYVLYELINRINENSTYYDLDSISYIENGKVISNEVSPIKGQPNVSPAYYLLPKELELVPRVYTSRGCINCCDFCSPSKFFGHKCIVRAADQVINEIVEIHENYKFDVFLIGDLTFYMNNESFEHICRYLSANDFGKWWCQTQISQLNERSISLLRNAKCCEVAVGFEDMSIGNEKIRKKNPSKLYAKSICRLLKKARIKIQGYWLFGTENENFESSLEKIKDMCEFIREDLMDTVHISFFIPYPNVITNKYFIDSNNYSRYVDLKSNFYDELPLYHTEYLTSKEIYLLTQLAISCCANEFYRKRIE